MKATDTRRLGRTGLELTVLGLGGAPLGNSLRAVAEPEAEAAIAAAWELGLRYFDVAPQYGHGLAEHRFGHVLRRHPRASFVLSTKVGRLTRANRQGTPVAPSYVDPLPFDLIDIYTRDAIIRSVEDSLQRLGLNRIDILYIHNIDAGNHPPDELERLFRLAMAETYPVLDRLRAEGLVGAIGVGNNYAEMCERFARAGDFDCFLLAGRYTLLEQGALDSFLPLCRTRGIGVVIGGAFNSGILATGPGPAATYDYRPAEPAILNRVRLIDRVCRAHEVPLAAAALQFPLGHPSVASVVAGPRSAEEIRANAALLSQAIPPGLWSDLKSEDLLRADASVPELLAEVSSGVG